MNAEIGLLRDYLKNNRAEILRQWLDRMVERHAECTSRFVLMEQDQFRNPVGNVLRQNLPALLDAILEDQPSEVYQQRLDEVVRVRAVQDVSAAEAVSFVFSLKDILRRVLEGKSQIDPDGKNFAALESRVDAMALLAFDLYVGCRAQTFEIKRNEARRRIFVGERIQAKRRDLSKDDS